MRILISVMVIASLVTLIAPVTGQAQAPECEFDYTVQAGDWLSRIADKYFGDLLAYPSIVAANNAQADDAYTNIEDPDVIEPGWVLCIPPGGEAPVGDQSMETSEETSAAATGQSLAGTSWILTSLNGREVLPQPAVTAKFGEDGRLSGSGGCNNYNTAYQVEGNSLTIDLIAATMMACPDPIGGQETTYFATLGSAATYQIGGDTLELKDAKGTTVAAFTAMKTVSLPGTSWVVRAYNNGQEAVVSVIIGTQLTATFGEDGNLTGSAGCNDYFASYTVDGETISIGPAGATRKFCAEPEGIMEQEQQYLAALQTAATYQLELDTLEMRTAEGARVATFVSAVTGSVTLADPVTLPNDAVVQVQLQDVSLADAPAQVIGEQLIPGVGQQGPIPFEVTFNPADIDPRHTYSMQVRITDGQDKLLFINTQAYPVLTRDNPIYNVEVTVEAVN